MPQPKNGRPRSKKKPPKTLKKIRSPRQLIAAQKLSEILGNAKGQKNITLGKILKEAGYSDTVCKSPKEVTKGKGFQQLLKERLSDDLLTKTHEQLLQSSKLDHYVFPKSEDDAEIKATIESVAGCKLVKIRKADQWKRAYFWTPDNLSRNKAIDIAYKIRNKYPAEKHKVEGEIKTINITNYGSKKG